MGTATAVARPTAKGRGTRARILDAAEAAVLAKGFDATSIEEIVAGAEITRSGFFYHFPDKNALVRALIQRYVEADQAQLEAVFRRGAELADDPLQAFLIGLKLVAEMMDEQPMRRPGYLVAVCHRERHADAEVRELSRQALLAWRRLFLAGLERIAERYRPRDPIDLVALADMMSTTIEGGIVLARTLRDPQALARQMMLNRSYIKLLFAPEA